MPANRCNSVHFLAVSRPELRQSALAATTAPLGTGFGRARYQYDGPLRKLLQGHETQLSVEATSHLFGVCAGDAALVVQVSNHVFEALARR